MLTSFLWDVLRLRVKKKQPVTCWAHAWQATGCLMIVSTSPSSLRIRPLFKYYKYNFTIELSGAQTLPTLSVSDLHALGAIGRPEQQATASNFRSFDLFSNRCSPS